MGEPNSVIGDILQLILLAGTKRVQHAGMPAVEQHKLKPGDIKSIGHSSAAYYDGAVDTEYFTYRIPKDKCLIVTYCSLYTSLSGDVSENINFGIYVDAHARWQTKVNDLIVPVTPYQEVALYTNTPCLYVFPGGVTPQIQLRQIGAPINFPLIVYMKYVGYLIDATFQGEFEKHQTLAATPTA